MVYAGILPARLCDADIPPDRKSNSASNDSCLAPDVNLITLETEVKTLMFSLTTQNKCYSFTVYKRSSCPSVNTECQLTSYDVRSCTYRCQCQNCTGPIYIYYSGQEPLNVCKVLIHPQDNGLVNN